MISLARDLCTYKAEGLLQGETKELLVGKKISYFVVLVCLKIRKVNKRSSTAVIKKVPQSTADFLKACKVDTLKKKFNLKKKKKKRKKTLKRIQFCSLFDGTERVFTGLITYEYI